MKNLILDVRSILSVFEFLGYLFRTFESLDLSIMKFSFTKIFVLKKYLMRLHLVDRCSLTTIKRKTLK